MVNESPWEHALAPGVPSLRKEEHIMQKIQMMHQLSMQPPPLEPPNTSLFLALVATTHAIVKAKPSCVLTRVPYHRCYCWNGSRKIWSKISFLWVVSQSWSNEPAQTETSFGGIQKKLLWMPLWPHMFFFLFQELQPHFYRWCGYIGLSRNCICICSK